MSSRVSCKRARSLAEALDGRSKEARHQTYWIDLSVLPVPASFTPYSLCPSLSRYLPADSPPSFERVAACVRGKGARQSKPKRSEDEEIQCCCKGRANEPQQEQPVHEESNDCIPSSLFSPADPTRLPEFPVAVKKHSVPKASQAPAAASFNCGDNCLNRLLFVECTEFNCPLPPGLCSNRLFSSAPVDKCYPFRTELKGWGLKAKRDLKPGEFVVEYVGEVINNAECHRRLAREHRKLEQRLRLIRRVQQRVHRANENNKGKASAIITEDVRQEVIQPREANYYFLTVSDDVIIDAGQKGGLGRFFNHSCNPNCVVQKWNVGGVVRVAMFVKDKAIPADTELTIDYQYERIGQRERQPCFCGESNCAKFIGGEKKQSEQERSKGAAAQIARDAAYANADEVCALCGDGGDMIMCDAQMPDGDYCRRVYHTDCLIKGGDQQRAWEKKRAAWHCPYHTCMRYEGQGPPHQRSRVFCACCSDSLCAPCYAKDRTGLHPLHASTSPWLDNIPANSSSSLFVLCSDCHREPVVLKADERQRYYQYKKQLKTRK